MGNKSTVDLSFYQKHLNNVSRSFAFCILRLDPPLRNWVALMYLLCRIADTAEDVPWNSLKNKEKFFADFRMQLKYNSFVGFDISDKKFSEVAHPDELLLINESKQLFQDFHQLDKPIQLIIIDLVFSMSRGMEYFLKNYSQSGQFELNSLKQLNKYCFYVAGVVGEALTRLLGFLNGEDVGEEQLKKSYHFGLFLQKINILKDYLKDKSEGRCFVKDFSELRASVVLHADEAFEYITAIDNKNIDYKIFCSWSFFLALASLPFIDESYKKKRSIKISRLQTLTLTKKVELFCGDNGKLKNLYDSFKQKNCLVSEGLKLHSEKEFEDQKWMSSYQGLLPAATMQGLVNC